jgi:RNA polymerase sigma-70 factor, ECF subfamily
MGTVPDVTADDRRFTEVYERCYPLVLAYARRRADEATARDVAAETFTAAWRRFDELKHIELPWLYKTAQHQLQNAQRARARRDRLQVRVVARLAATEDADHADAIAGRDFMARALHQLRPADRELLLLTSWEDLDIRTAASVLGISANAAGVRLHRARRRLAALLERQEQPDVAGLHRHSTPGQSTS